MNGLTDPTLAEPVQNLSSMEWLSHKRANSSVIDDLFTFQCIELKMCSGCCRSTANVQTMNILAIPIPPLAESCSLLDCLQLFIESERLQGRNGLHCEQCQAADQNATPSPALNTPVGRYVTRSILASTALSPIPSDTKNAVAQFSLLSSTPLPGPTNKTSSTAPPQTQLMPKIVTEGVRQCFLRRLQECVIIQLLRFCYDPSTKKVTKVHTPINLSLELDLLPYTFDSAVLREDMTCSKDGFRYSLYAVCLHIGGERTNSGHYLCYCLAADSKWYKFDDEYVSLVENFNSELNKAVVKENCYLLFYKKHHAVGNEDS